MAVHIQAPDRRSAQAIVNRSCASAPKWSSHSRRNASCRPLLRLQSPAPRLNRRQGIPRHRLLLQAPRPAHCAHCCSDSR